MKTFEEKFTAWVDGRLTGPDLAAFERELESSPEALADRDAALDLGNLLRTHLTPAPLKNADFFNHQLLQQIQASEPVAERSTASAPATPFRFWSLWRMASTGAFLLLVSTGLYFAAIPSTRRLIQHNAQFVQVNVIDAHTDDPAITATSFHSKENNANVLWLDGLNYMPPAHKLK